MKINQIVRINPQSKHRFFVLLNSIWAIPVVIFIRCFRPFYVVKFGTFFADRIGHFAADVGQRHAESKQSECNNICLYWLPTETANSFWADMVKRSFLVSPWYRYLWKWNKIIPGGSPHHIASSYTGSRDIFGFLEKQKCGPKFTLEEDLAAKKWLSQFGWQDGDPFVVLLARDSKYLSCHSLHGDGSIDSLSRTSYHSYRNTDIASYVPAINWLARQGVLIFRMGSMTEKKLDVKNDKIIDYSFRKDKSDFLDVWLFAHTSLCITTGTGPDMISDVYRKPILALNFTPISYLFSWSNALHAPRHLKWAHNGSRLSLNEHIANSWLHTNAYVNAKVLIEDLSSDEILKITQECWGRLLGTWIDSSDELIAQELFWKILCESSDASLNHWIHPDARISSVFLRNSPGFLN